MASKYNQYKKLTIGDTVVITSISRIYMTYKSAFEFMRFRNTLQNPDTTDLKQFENTEFKVFAIGFGKFANLVALERGSIQILIGDCGIEIKQ